MTKRDKPLNVLVITGAGASANLGADATALPMMKGWAADLIPRLGFAGNELGINAETDGPAFEAILGRFLKFANSLDAVASFGFMGEQTNVVGEGPRNSTGANFNAWLPNARSNISALNRRLWESLWENFGRDRIDGEKADTVYSALHALIRESRGPDDLPCYIAHATTNFDTAIEVAVQESTYPNTQLLDGFTPGSGNARPRWAPNLLTSNRLDSDARIPVVHLHGAVGWYFDPNDQNRIQRRPSDDNYDDRLTPALLLPDDTKNPDSFPAPLAEVWEQFKILLREATHVLVIGHSLHDEHMVRAINEAKVPTAVMSLGGRITKDSTRTQQDHQSASLDDQVSAKDAMKAVLEGDWIPRDRDEPGRIRKAIPGAAIVLGEFGSGELSSDFDTAALTKWLDGN